MATNFRGQVCKRDLENDIFWSEIVSVLDNRNARKKITFCLYCNMQKKKKLEKMNF